MGQGDLDRISSQVDVELRILIFPRKMNLDFQFSGVSGDLPRHNFQSLLVNFGDQQGSMMLIRLFLRKPDLGVQEKRNKH